MTARLPLQVVTAWHGVEVVTLHVVGLHAQLHGQDGGQGPEVGPALARVTQGLTEERRLGREVGHSIDSLQHLHCRPQSVVVREPHVLQLLPGGVLAVRPDTLPVKAAVTTSRSISVLQAVVERQTKNFRGRVESSEVIESLILRLVREAEAGESEAGQQSLVSVTEGESEQKYLTEL